MITMTPEMAALEVRLKTTGMAGDYGRFAQHMEQRYFNGPTNRPFATLDGSELVALRKDLEQLWTAPNRTLDGTEITSE